ncbi:DUF2690 domain-containing protein [Streptomyces sp. NPDC048434]|uniref:DUF2690 domain-containing protein n=1 Tax=Streptomyces sp. NPDC048434 TaxID=3365549 RepID=UPI00371FADAF
MTSGPDDPVDRPAEGPAGGRPADDPADAPADAPADELPARYRPDRRLSPDTDPDPDTDTDPALAPPDSDPTSPSPSLPQRARARLRGVGPWLRAHARHALVVGVVTAIAGALATVGADQLPKLFAEPPPGCPGAGCDGRNPKDTACAYDAVTWEPTVGNPVRIQLRYSKDCGDVWGRIVNGEPGDMVTLRVAGGSARSASIDYNHDKYTAMTTVGSAFRVRLCAVPSTSPHRIGKWIKYCFEATEHAAWD